MIVETTVIVELGESQPSIVKARRDRLCMAWKGPLKVASLVGGC